MRTHVCLCALLALLLPAFGFGLSGQAGPYRVELISDPQILPVGKARIDIFVTDDTGTPTEGASITAIAQMPNMPMGEREQMAVPTGVPGHYRFTQAFSMAGAYEARIHVRGTRGAGEAKIPLATGKTTTTSSTAFPASVIFLWPWVVGLGVVAFVGYRMYKTGQRVDVRRAITRPVIGAVALLALVSAGAVYAINNFRRLGAMTPLEAQTMSMDMPPPEGVLAVTLATAEKRPLSATVRYSGQAVGFVEQEINARTSGVIVWMPGYVGTKVRKGEVVARLDTSQLAPQLSQGQAGVQSARAGVRVAEADYRQVLAAVRQAEAELSRAEGTVGESRANLASARAERDAALSDAESARASVGEALASLASAEADLRYWTEELRRQSSLFAAGAVSKEEYDREKADADKSEATVRQTRAQARGAEAKVGTSEAMARRAAANVAASQKKLEQARADVHAHRAHVAAARAAVTSSGAKIAQSRAAVRQAEADLKGAAAQAGFAEIRSQADGVITQRSISPGTLVSPGQTLLRVAQIQPIRLQANVPASDLARIRVGGSVLVRRSDARDRGAVARVSSISPALDPVSRTGTVEVVLENRERAFLPGQFVLLEFTIGPREERTVVPAAAIQRNVAGGTSVQADATATFVWVAEPVSGTADRYTVSRRSVQLGEAAGELVAINGGLAPGARIVVSGAASLSEGYAVIAPSPVLSRAASSAQILVTEKGFEPPVLNLAAGGPRRVTFLRKTDATCATEVVFPMLKITRKLPLNEVVTIDLPPSASGSLNYACGMNMLKGQVQLP